MSLLTDIILVLTLILFFVIIMIQKGTIMALRAELHETKKWIDHNLRPHFWKD